MDKTLESINCKLDSMDKKLDKIDEHLYEGFVSLAGLLREIRDELRKPPSAVRRL